MKICGIVGLKNTGKTYFAQKLISFFSIKKIRVATIKHAHHDFDIDTPGSDSFLHRQSGAQEVIISSSKRWASISELKGFQEKNLYELINEQHNPEIVIVEGFKKESHPKIEIIKKNSDPETFLFPYIKNVIGIVSNDEIKSSITQFREEDIEKLANFILNNS